MSACPMETSERKGMDSEKKRRFSRLRFVPCIERQSEGASVLSSLDEGSYSLGAICRIVRSVGLGVKLDAVGAKGSSCIKVLEIRPDEDRGAYAPSVELTEDLGEEVAVTSYVPARITRQSIGGIGH